MRACLAQPTRTTAAGPSRPHDPDSLRRLRSVARVPRRARVTARAVSDGPDAADDATAPLRPPCVIHEDDDVLVIDKPAGMSFHNDDLATNLPGVVSTVRALQASGTLRGTDYAGAVHSVHRLDKTTSGILLLAKNERVASWLTAQFAARRVHKYYVALSAKRPSKKMGTVRGDMAKSRRGAWKLTRPEKGKSPAAVTKFASRGVRGASPDGEGEEGRSLRMLLMRPLTGKTHQLRVCAKSLGSPVLGDDKYSGKSAGADEDRGYLHAAALRVAMPGGNVMDVVCKPSEGNEWADVSSGFHDAWIECGFHELLGADEWFGGVAAGLLASRRSELFDKGHEDDECDDGDVS